MTTSRTRRQLRRAIALLTAALTALALTAPATALEARSWPVAGQGPDNAAAGQDSPSAPEVRWGADAQSGDREFGSNELSLPVVHPDGVLIRGASIGGTQPVLIGQSTEDGEVLWQLDDVVGSCVPAVDSQDRLWVLRSADADDDLDVRFVQQIDALDGTPVDGTEFALDPDGGLPDARLNLWCHGSSLHVAGSGADEVLIVLGNSEAGTNNDHLAALDLAGAAPSLAWTIDAEDADYERILVDVPGNRSESAQARVGAFTDSHWLLPVLRNGEPHLDRIALSNGSYSPGPPIPVLDEDDGSPATGTNPWSARTLITGDTAVVSLRHTGFGTRSVLTSVHGFALSDLSLNWTDSQPRRNSTANAGATVLTATDSLVAYNAELGRLFAVQRSTGAPTDWSGDLEIRELGAGANPSLLTDADGNVLTVTSDGGTAVSRITPDGSVDWRVTPDDLAGSGVTPAENADLQVAALAGGIVYVVDEGRMWAIGQDPDAPAPGPTDPDPTDPEPTDPDPTDPDPTEPDPTEPDPTDPEPTDPGPIAPPSAVGGWPVAGQGPANTSQASVEGPSDPGLKWAVDLEDDTDLSFGTGALDNPILHPDGVLVRRAEADAFDEVLVGVSASDGSVQWQLDDVAGSCVPAVDSRDRLWVLRSADADDDVDVRFVQQIDAVSGQPVDGTAFALDPDDGLPDARNNLWCHGSSLHVAGSGADEVLIVLGNSADGRNNDHVAALDLSGDAPSLAWIIDAEDPETDYERILVDVPGNVSDSPQARVGAFTDSHWLLPVLRNGEPHLDRIVLADGTYSSGTQIPVLDEDDQSAATGTNPWSARTLITGDTVVVSLRHTGFGTRSVLTSVHGFALSDLSLNWTDSQPRRNSTANAGATVLTATDSLVAYNAELGRLFAVQRSTGAPTDWSGDLEIRELGANATPNILADAAGNLYVIASRDAGTVVRLSPTGQEQWRFSSNALELETGIAPGTNARLALIDAAGTLYLVNEGRMFAIDSSGGIEDCVLPFEDVDEDRNVHAVNICRLVELGITGGTSPTTYDPFGDVTRAQMASFLARALNLEPIDNPAQPFPDVEPGSTHAGNINAIRAAGITQGLQDGTYDPSGSVTRAQMASFLANAAGLEPVVGGTGFTDVDPSNVHAPNIYAVRDAEITTGITASTFEPTRNVRRDQMASFLIRMLDYLAEQG